MTVDLEQRIADIERRLDVIESYVHVGQWIARLERSEREAVEASARRATIGRREAA